MRRSNGAIAAGALLLFGTITEAGPVAADGEDRFELAIVNATAAPLSCEAALAHWFSTRLGAIAAGRTMRLPLARGEDGVVTIEVAAGDRAPVERIWCGRVGRAFETGGTVPLPRTAVPDATSRAVTCRTGDDGARIRCEPSGR